MNKLKKILNEKAQVLCKSANLRIDQVELWVKNISEENDDSKDMFLKMQKENLVKIFYVSERESYNAIIFPGLHFVHLEQKGA
jgi:hypothetical protein